MKERYFEAMGWTRTKTTESPATVGSVSSSEKQEALRKNSLVDEIAEKATQLPTNRARIIGHVRKV